MAQFEDKGLIFEGSVMVRNRRIAGSGFYPIGNTIALKIKTEFEKKERISRKKGSYGMPLDTIIDKQPTSVSFEIDTFNRANLAMVLMGESAAIAPTSLKVTDEAVTVAEKGIWYKLANDNIDETSVKVKAGASATPLEAADYELIAGTGMISIRESAAGVQAGDEIKVTYNTRAGGGFRIDADLAADYDLELQIDGFNKVTQKHARLHIPSAVVASASELDWFAADFNTATFEGTLVLVGGYKSTYTYSEFA